jgi:hypothetical protein
MKKSMLVKLIDKWESEKGSYIPNVPIYDLFIGAPKISQEYKDLLESVANYRKVQIATDQVVDALYLNKNLI